ncbi:DUF4397 domain-containing protein [Exiguobacterium mexicanum]|uniref:DUF4397 domain-containing protein n=1 Tax=Exiguobacterium mexicanum TaxID=340146 RepID=A0ABT7MLC4_9BACL|nr:MULTISPECIES: DUF4397 domain-containing protein [Exiguobacterium]MDL5376222.1 DUF4397 domain-containing protein [Exiguobacterium mexicanum]
MKKLMSLLGTLALAFALIVPVSADGHENAMVRVLHASPDAPAVDVYVNGEVAVEGAEFKALTDYLTLPAGDYNVEIKPAGDTETVVVAADLSIEAGKFYTAAAIGQLENIEIAAMEDDANFEDGKSKVRVAHFAPDAPAVDVAPKGGDPLFSNLEFKAVSDYGTLDAGTYDLEVRPAGATDVVKALDGVALEGGKNYTAFAIGLLEGEPAFEVLLAADGGEMAGAPDTGQGGLAQTASMNWLLAAAVLGAAAAGFYVFRRQKQDA